MVWYGLVWISMVWYGFVFGMIWFDLTIMDYHELSPRGGGVTLALMMRFQSWTIMDYHELS